MSTPLISRFIAKNLPDLNASRTQMTPIFWSFLSKTSICSVVRSTFSNETIVKECQQQKLQKYMEVSATVPEDLKDHHMKYIMLLPFTISLYRQTL